MGTREGWNVRCIVLGYHDIENDSQVTTNGVRVAASSYAISHKTFVRHLDTIYNRTDRQAFSDAVRLNTCAHATPLLITFDDGGVGAYTCAADELEARGWRGNFLVTTKWIGTPGFLDRRQMRDLHGRGHVIGSHTVSHPSRMSALSYRQLLTEWTDSCAAIADILGCTVDVASVADGYYSTIVGEAARDAGIRLLFNSEPSTRVLRVDSCLIVGRYSVRPGMTAAECAAIASGDRWPRYKQSMSWTVKKVAKVVLGETYLRWRKNLLAGSAAAEDTNR